MTAPEVSILVPTRSRAGLLRQAIASGLAQEGEVEVVVTDNASEDETPEVMKSFADPRLRYIRNPRDLGMVGNWNVALEAARGRYVKLLMDDDVLEPGCVKTLVRALQAAGGPVIASCTGRRIDAGGAPLGEDAPAGPGEAFAVARDEALRAMYLDALPLRTPTHVLFARPDPPLRFDEAYPLAADVAMWTELVARGGAVLVNRPLVRQRVHGAQLSAGNRPARRLEEALRFKRRMYELLPEAARATVPPPETIASALWLVNALSEARGRRAGSALRCLGRWAGGPSRVRGAVHAARWLRSRLTRIEAVYAVERRELRPGWEAP